MADEATGAAISGVGADINAGTVTAALAAFTSVAVAALTRTTHALICELGAAEGATGAAVGEIRGYWPADAVAAGLVGAAGGSVATLARSTNALVRLLNVTCCAAVPAGCRGGLQISADSVAARLPLRAGILFAAGALATLAGRARRADLTAYTAMVLRRLQVDAGVVTDVLTSRAGTCSRLAGAPTRASDAGSAGGAALLIRAPSLAGLAVTAAAARSAIAGTGTGLAALPGDARLTAGPAVTGIAADVLASLPAFDRGWLALFLLFLFCAYVVGIMFLLPVVHFAMGVASTLVAVVAVSLLPRIALAVWQEWQDEAAEQPTQCPAPCAPSRNAAGEAVKP